MRFVIKPSEHITAKLASLDTYNKLLEIVNSLNKDLISDSIYRDAYDTLDGKRSYVEDALSKSYYNKCAYCERITKADIEHYRPKKAVDGVEHHGYYWLCYEWSNLIPSCITCNREGAKHNKFPILGNRVYTPNLLPDLNIDLQSSSAYNSPLLDENPILLHPEIDNPGLFFGFEPDEELKGIKLKCISDNEDIIKRAHGTIEICKLNRQELKLDRLEIVNDLLNNLNYCFLNYGEDQIVERIFEHYNIFKSKSLDEKVPYTLLRRYIISSVDAFKEVVLPFSKRQKLVLRTFESWINNQI